MHIPLPFDESTTVHAASTGELPDADLVAELLALPLEDPGGAPRDLRGDVRRIRESIEMRGVAFFESVRGSRGRKPSSYTSGRSFSVSAA